MSRGRFDALTRLLGVQGSRRTALGTMLGAAVLGHGLPSEAKNKKNRKNKQKKKPNPPPTCFGTRTCGSPGPGLDFENCDFSGQDVCSHYDCGGSNFRRVDLSGADLSDGIFQGASFRNANLRLADLEDADVSGASFRDACLVGANFSGANTDGTHFGGAIFCNTTLPDGSIDDSGCDNVTDCCPGAGCGVCEPDDMCCAGSCCPFFCDCADLVPGPGVVCITDEGLCDFPCGEGCPQGWFCVDDGGCPFAHCHPRCDADNEERRGAGRESAHWGR